MQKELSILEFCSRWSKRNLFNVQMFKYLFPQLHQKCVRIHLLHNEPVNYVKNSEIKQQIENDVLVSVFTLVGFIIILLCLYSLMILIRFSIF